MNRRRDQQDRLHNEMRVYWHQLERQQALELREQTGWMDDPKGPLAPGRGHRAPTRFQRVMRFLRGAR